ncbi:MAG: GNAT family N-acetyltransferase [Actinobacteria bacterium]|nr:GNAT family N-acetyltransferase [Actinomycetota bacterium]
MPKENEISIRFAVRDDIATILGFIEELAAYEKMSDQVIADKDTLAEWIFDKGKAQVLLADLNDETVGMALFFNNFSTFLGRAGIYLEDLYVQPHARGKGLGKSLLAKLASICVEEGYGRLEWACLDWNKPSIDFYLSLGAQQMDEWTDYRLCGDAISQLAAEYHTDSNSDRF